ncbi:hypothetical protein CN093_08640 [Sinorhizobium meliloti]|uniref:hypothetical protein n=1 Tax=Rhizobium meliloti TaxID=382 RepID=UPI000FD1FD90|nr:hypothetical protein [Sinorhizobium meliloti]RVO41324.1 hypothetical protein CN093_08640 [Sinorhizobium meliloti]
MRIYLAHPVSDYGTERQAATIDLLRSRGWQVENPDQPHHARAYKARGMQHFVEVVEDCDGLAFLRFPDRSIGAGVAKEIETALRRGLMVWDASSGQLESIGTMMPSPVLSVEETRAMLAARSNSTGGSE